MTRTYAEPAIDTGARVNPIGWIISIGFVLLGQVLLMLSSQAEATTSPIAQQINDTLLLGLTGDTALILFGVIALIVGTVLFAIVTRRAALSDYQPLSIVEAGGNQRRTPWLLLAVAIGGTGDLATGAQIGQRRSDGTGRNMAVADRVGS